MIDLKKTNAICQAATAGTERHGSRIVVDSRYQENDGTEEGVTAGSVDEVVWFQAKADAIFWEHARTALPELVEWAERALQVLRDVAQGMEDHGQHVVATALRGIAAELERVEPADALPPDDPDTVPREWWDQLKRFIRESKSSVSPCLLLEEMHALENGR